MRYLRWARRQVLAAIAALAATLAPAYAQTGLSGCTPVTVLRETPETITVAATASYVTTAVVTVPRAAVFYVARLSVLCQRGPYFIVMLPERAP